MDQDRVISFIQDLYQSRANDILRNVIKGLFVTRNPKLLSLTTIAWQAYHELDILALTPLEIRLGIVLEYERSIVRV